MAFSENEALAVAAAFITIAYLISQLGLDLVWYAVVAFVLVAFAYLWKYPG